MTWLILFATVQATVSPRPASQTLDHGQAHYDESAARLAAGMRGKFRERQGGPLPSRRFDSDRDRRSWREVTDADLRERSSYPAPLDYRHHRSVRVDLDHDGRPDVVEMVERARQFALRISYGDGRSRLTARHDGRWTDQGLFAAGLDAVLVNFPESAAYFLFQREGALRVEYLGD